MVAQCLQSNVSLASLAVEHGMNPNVLHRWVAEHERYGRGVCQGSWNMSHAAFNSF
jgi:transposase-like protein